jgi:hypothetical protein
MSNRMYLYPPLSCSVWSHNICCFTIDNCNIPAATFYSQFPTLPRPPYISGRTKTTAAGGGWECVSHPPLGDTEREEDGWFQENIIYLYSETNPVQKSIIFWDVTPCSLFSCNWRFDRTYRLHLQGRRNNSSKNQQVSRQIFTWTI